MLPGLFALTLFVSAALLFLVQPLVGKLLLPIWGGTPAVWNTCLFFFQALLLLGYLYAHLVPQRLGTRRQALGHLLLLLLPVGSFGVAWHLSGSPLPLLGNIASPTEEFPLVALLTMLLTAVGVPFFALATTGPLLQRWFAALPSHNHDPYVLYAASNAGSLLGLAAYPLLVEPNLGLGEQRLLWAGAVIAWTFLVAICALATWRYAVPSERLEASHAPPLPRRRWLRWLALSALSAALLNTETAHLTTDLTPMPLLWVVPLALYLISFILVFARWPDRAHRLTGRFAPMLLLFLIVVLTTRSTEPLPIVLGLHLVVFFALVLVLHGELARDRPDPVHLTAFYLVLALGSVLGSLGCVLVAPLVFHRLGVIEYPLVLVLVAFIRPRELHPPDGFWQKKDLAAPVLLAMGAAALVVAVPRLLGPPVPADSPNSVPDWMLRSSLMFGLPGVVAYALVARPVRYALCLAALLVVSEFDPGPNGVPLHTERNFFGTLRVTRSPDGEFIRLIHGTTQHGQQRPTDDPPRALMYYYPTGPAGRVLRMLPPERRHRVGVVGLGCGALAAYARKGEEWVFWEIDPAVVRIAQDTRWFTYLDRCQGEVRIVLGDARQQMEKEPDESFDVLVLDAFSSDAIPMHMLTREAMALYARKLKPQGLILFHVSNRYLDLPPLLERLAQDHSPPLVARMESNLPMHEEGKDGKMRSTWVLLARQPEALTLLSKDIRWEKIPPMPGPVWTDTYSNVVGLWKAPEDRWSAR